MINLQIKVTKEILNKSKNCSTEYDGSIIEKGIGTNCAIALAVRDIFPFAWVDEYAIIPYSKNFNFYGIYQALATPDNDNYIKLPKIASGFINEFDMATPEERAQMPEIEFTIAIPDAVIEQIDISAITEQLKNHSILKLEIA